MPMLMLWELQPNFLPWHRQFVSTHEKYLQKECNYQGAQPLVPLL